MLDGQFSLAVGTEVGVGGGRLGPAISGPTSGPSARGKAGQGTKGALCCVQVGSRLEGGKPL